MRDEFRVASYNVKVSGEDDGQDAWDQRVDAVTGAVRHHRPDVIGIQEPTAEQLDDLRDRLPAYRWVGVGRRDGERGGELSPVGFRKERFDLAEADTFWLSETPDAVGSVGWDANLPRILTWARLRDPYADTSLFFANTHFSHVGERARRESARLIRERLTTLADDDPVVLVGDFNSEPSAEAYERLVKAEPAPALSDAKSRSKSGHHGPDHTFTGFSDLTTGRRIDYVFVSSNVAVEHHATCVELRADGRLASDHFPVMVDVSVD